MLILEIALGVLLGGLFLRYLHYFLVFGFLAMALIACLAMVVLAVFLLVGFSPNILIAVFCMLVLFYFLLKWKIPHEKSTFAIQNQINKRKALGYDVSNLEGRLQAIEAEYEMKKSLESIRLKEEVAVRNAAKEIAKTRSKVSKWALDKELKRRKSLGYED